MALLNQKNKKALGLAVLGVAVSIGLTRPAFAIFPPIFDTGTTTVGTTPVIVIPTPSPVTTTIPTTSANPVPPSTVSTQGDPGSTVSTQGNPSSGTPEPTSMALGLMGLAALGGRALRSRLRRNA